MELHHPTVLKTGTYFVAGPKSIHRCRRYPTKFNSGRDIPLKAWGLDTLSWDVHFCAHEPWHRMCPEVRGKRTAPSTPSSEYQIRRQPPRVREPRSDVGNRRCVVVESGQRR